MSSVQLRGDKYQLRVKHKLLPKPYFKTFDDETEAANFGVQLEAMLARGYVPSDLMTAGPKGLDPTMPLVVSEYLRSAPVTDSDAELLASVVREVKLLRVSGVTFKWVEGYVRGLKLGENLAPGTIRKRIGVLARVLDWHFRRTAEEGKMMPVNPLRMLPAGYSQYSRTEIEALDEEKLVKQDVKRDYRVGPAEEQKVRLSLSGQKRADRERGLVVDESLILLFDLVVDTGLRLSEAYRLRCDQIDLVKGVLRVEGSKGTRGILKPRVVPLKRGLREKLGVCCAGRSGLVFPFWDGTPEDKRKASKRLSRRFSKLFDYAGVGHLTEHDLRHEACCRWIELRNAEGRWVFSDVEVCRIMGWSSTAMMLRYASLRGEDLADRLL